MIDPRTFLATVSRSTQERAPAPRAARLATVDPAYTSGDPKVTFDGDDSMSPDGFAVATGYVPVPGERVLMVPVGQGWMVVGNTSTSSGGATYPGDVEITDPNKGFILRDRVNGNRYRLFVSGGVLGTELA